MKVVFKYLSEFEHRAKSMAKKYKSFISDYDAFLDALEKDPYQGVSLGGGVYKTRMAIISKGKGKSGGARVLTYNAKKVSPEIIVITLISIFDKGEIENVSDSYIRSLVKEIKKKSNHNRVQRPSCTHSAKRKSFLVCGQSGDASPTMITYY